MTATRGASLKPVTTPGSTAARPAANLGIALLASVTISGASSSWVDAADQKGSGVIDLLRQHHLRTLDGRTVVLGNLEGSVVVLNFWASWCKPCKREMPVLDQMYRNLSKRGVRFAAISIDRDAGNAEAFIRGHKLSIPVLHDNPDGLAKSLDLPYLPCTFVIDSNGRTVFTTAGSDAQDMQALRAAIDGQLARTPAGEAGQGTR